MRFHYCLAISVAVHAIIAFVVPVQVARARAADVIEAEPITVRVAEEPPIVEEPAPEEIPSEPIFAPGPEAEAMREGMGALMPEPAPRQPHKQWSDTPRDETHENPPQFSGVSPEADSDEPAAPDPETSDEIAPTRTGPDDLASEALGDDPSSTDTARYTEGAPAAEGGLPTPASPPGDTEVGTGRGGPDREGEGTSRPAEGRGPAAEGEGEGRDARGTGSHGPGGGDSGSGRGNEGGTGDANQGGTAPPPKPDGRWVAVATPPCYPGRLAERLGLNGRSFTVNVSVSASGTVTSASLAGSTGDASLDATLVNHVRSRFRYQWQGGGSPTAKSLRVQVRIGG